MHVRNEKAEKWRQSGKCLTFHQQMPATLGPCSRSREKPRCSVQPPTFCHETSAHSAGPVEMEKVEVATTVVTLPESQTRSVSSL